MSEPTKHVTPIPCPRCTELEKDLRMVRSGRDAFHKLYDDLQSKIVNKWRPSGLTVTLKP